MAITKVGVITSPPASITDYDNILAHLNAYAKQVGNQGMILTQWTNTTTAPAIALGSYIHHGGTLFVVDTEDYAVTAPVSDGTYYLKVIGSGDTLLLSWISSLTGYAWNAIYNGLYHSDGSQILPYQLVVSGSVSVFAKRKVTNLMQGSGFVTVDYLGSMVATSLDTGHGANELYPMNQDVRSSASPAFADATISSKLLSTYLGYLNQGVKDTDSPTFANIFKTNSISFGDNVISENTNTYTTSSTSFVTKSTYTFKEGGTFTLKFAMKSGYPNKTCSVQVLKNGTEIVLATTIESTTLVYKTYSNLDILPNDILTFNLKISDSATIGTLSNIQICTLSQWTV